MIENIFKFTNQPMMKITFKQTSVVPKAKESGMKMFHMSIPPHQIQKEENTNITTCMRCYAHEGHYINQCSKGKQYIVCSENGQEGHTFFNCTNQDKTCLNCVGKHRTLAYKCPQRKDIRKKKEVLKNKKNETYSQTVTTNANIKPTYLLTYHHRKLTQSLHACYLHTLKMQRNLVHLKRN